ncbi:hypothetical protein A2318_02420 [Candidatus Uhrbacteria bacterium RIFOXYB2_FULL_45_11]|uniref:EamA domain-containing protein n=1 Tax=Candidatus Uhrbacteria bacterium RIFOXYB2_FULL_45_11 TaxID=1802421 RepID=A0A1F7W8Q2_9BACT|nr:MAG: hypothetical protein A2318_02420 [Candidatus Uhrbacteria bacterium RIFOXYB2_FULL_45_11]
MLNAHIDFFDAALAGSVISMIASAARGLFDVWVKRSISIPQVDMVASTMAGASVFGFCWMMYESGFSLPQFPTPNQWAALVYLGIMPTAASSIISNTVRDKLSYQITEILDNLRPMFLLFLGMIPVSWFFTPEESLDWNHYFAIFLAISGVCIVTLLAKGERKT